MFNLIIRFILYYFLNVIITDFLLGFIVFFISLLGIIYKPIKFPTGSMLLDTSLPVSPYNEC